MTYYEERLMKAELKLQYVKKGFMRTVKGVSCVLQDEKSEADIMSLVKDLRLACDIMEEAMDDVESAAERVREENERYETL